MIFLADNIYFLLWLFLLGASIGSFLNVVIYRVPRDESIVKPGSRCPSCEKPIKGYDNIPVISWILLRGKCRNCKSKISIRYPIIEAIVGLIFVIMFKAFGLSWEFLHYTALSVVLLTVSLIDIDYQVIPDSILVTGFIIGLVTVGIGDVNSLSNALIGAVVMGGILLAFGLIGEFILKKEAMGFGDVKLCAMIGLYIGWEMAIMAVFLSAIIAFVFGMGAILLKKLEFGKAFAFGPFLSAAGLISAFWGDIILAAYIRWAFGV